MSGCVIGQSCSFACRLSLFAFGLGWVGVGAWGPQGSVLSGGGQWLVQCPPPNTLDSHPLPRLPQAHTPHHLMSNRQNSTPDTPHYRPGKTALACNRSTKPQPPPHPCTHLGRQRLDLRRNLCQALLVSVPHNGHHQPDGRLLGGGGAGGTVRERATSMGQWRGAEQEPRALWGACCWPVTTAPPFACLQRLGLHSTAT